MIEIDGSQGEGGGQMVRTALALSTATGQPFVCKNIRAGREKPGLKAQHLTCVKALKAICKAETNNVQIGSERLEYTPKLIKSGIYEIDIGTAGSISLFFQALTLPCFFAPNRIFLKVNGGTCGKGQTPVEYFKEVVLPQMKHLAEKIELTILRRGYYPKGDGMVELSVYPKKKLFSEINQVERINLMERGDLVEIKGISYASDELMKAKVADRQADEAERLLQKLNVPVGVKVEYGRALSPGSGIVLWAVFEQADNENPVILGADALGELGKPAERVGEEAALSLLREIESGACVDKHLADQLIPVMGLLPGSRIKVSEITKHCRTNIYVVEKFLKVKFEIKEKIISSRLV